MPLYQEIGPLALFHQTENSQKDVSRYRYMFMKISHENRSQTIKTIKNVFDKFSPNYPFAYRFLTDDYQRLYLSEQQMGSTIQYFTFLAIFISCLGLLGLTSFTTEQRTKEIGIRKVLGARIHQVIILVMREFTALVAVANLIAWPVAYFAMRQVLQNYPFRINITITHFFLAGAISLVSAILTILYLALKDALRNPVESLNYE